MTMTTVRRRVHRLSDYEKWKKIARIILRYRLFKTRFISGKMVGLNCTEATKFNYAIAGVNYFNTGNIGCYTRVNMNLYRAIDEIKREENIEPLSPNYYNQKRHYKYVNKNNYDDIDNTSEISEIVEDTKNNVNDNDTEIAECITGVRIGDVIHIMSDEHDCNMFCKGVNAAGMDARVITMSVK